MDKRGWIFRSLGQRVENLTRCLESCMRVLAAQFRQRYGFPFFEHMVWEVGRVRAFIVRWRLLHVHLAERLGGVQGFEVRVA